MFEMSNTETLKALHVQSVMRYGIIWGRVGIRLRVKSSLLYEINSIELWSVQNLEIHVQIWGLTLPPPSLPKKKGGITVGAKPRNSRTNIGGLLYPPQKKVELWFVQNLEIHVQIWGGLLYTPPKKAELRLVQNLEIHVQIWAAYSTPPQKKKVELRFVQNLEIQTQICLTY